MYELTCLCPTVYQPVETSTPKMLPPITEEETKSENSSKNINYRISQNYINDLPHSDRNSDTGQC